MTTEPLQLQSSEESHASLQLVAQELATELNEARLVLEAFGERSEERGLIERFAQHLHLARGALRVAEVYGGALLAEEMEHVAQYVAAHTGHGKADPDGLDALLRAMEQLPAYLDRVASGGRDVPLALLPLLNDLRAVRGSALLSEGTLLMLNLRSDEPARPIATGPGTGAEIVELAKRMRPRFQLALLGLIRGDNADQQISALANIAEQFEGTASAQPQFQLWWVVGAVLEGLRDRGIENSVSIKRLLGHADREMRRLQELGEQRCADSPPVELLNNLLFYVARATSNGPRVAGVRRSFGLDDLLPGDEQIDEARETLSAPSVRLMKTVAAAIREDLTRVKDVLDIFVRKGANQVEDLVPQLEMLRKISDTLGVLGLGALRDRVQTEIESLRAIVDRRQPPDDASLLGIAAALIEVEDSLDSQLVKLIVPETGASADGEPTDDEFRAVQEAVLRECIVNMARIKEAITQALSAPAESQGLDQVPQLVRGITAGLLMLGKQRAVEVMEGIGRALGAVLRPSPESLTAVRLERLADAIVAVEYYMEMLQAGRPDHWNMLDNAQAYLGSLETDDLRVVALRAPRPADRPAREIAPPAAAEPPPATSPAAMPPRREEVGTDPEFVALFIEEARETLLRIAELVPQWQENPNDTDALREVRRAFHTLKGSGRMVGARRIGEFCWSIESLLNRLLSQTLQRSPDIVEIVREASRFLPRLIDELEHADAQLVDVAPLMARADALSGREPAPAAPPPERVETPASTRAEAPPEPAVVEEPEVESVDPVLQDIFRKEAAGHVSVLRDYISRCTTGAAPYAVTEALYRASHTLSGIAKTAGVRQGIKVAEPMEHYIRKLFESGHGLPEEGLSLLRDTAQSLGNVIAHVDEDSGYFPDHRRLIIGWHALERSLDAELASLAQAAERTVSTLWTAGEPPSLPLAPEPASLAIPEPSPLATPEPHEEPAVVEPRFDTVDFDLGEPEPMAALAIAAEAEAARPVADLVTEHAETREASQAIEADRVPEPGIPSEPHVPPQAERASAEEAPAAWQPSEPEWAPAEELPATWRPSEPERASEPGIGSPVEPAPEPEIAWRPAPEPEPEPEPGTAQYAAPEPEPEPETALEFDPDIAAIFSDEASELLEQSDAALGAWRRDRADRSHMIELKRLLHTLKGGARMAGIRAMGDLSHELESLLEAMQVGMVTDATAAIDVLQSSLDELHRLRDAASGGQPLGSVRELISRVRSIGAVSAAATPEPSAPAPVETEAPSAAHAVVAEPAAPEFAEAAMREQPPEVAAPERVAEFAAPEPTPEFAAPDQMPVFPAREREELAELSEHVPQPGAPFERLGREFEEPPVQPPVVERFDVESAAPIEAPPVEVSMQPVLPGREPASAVERQELARVDAELLDQLLNNAGEVSIFRARVEQQMTSIEFNLAELGRTVTRLREQLRKLELETEAQILHKHQDDVQQGRSDFDPLELDRYSTIQQLSRALAESVSDVASLEGLLGNLNRDAQNLLLQQGRIVTELQNGLMRTRMVPFERHVQRLARIVRQTAQEVGKQAELVTEGASGELDRQVLERMLPPFEHMLRNSVVHGIEAPDNRRRAGKPETGRIIVRLQREGAEVVITVEDDGAGLNVAAIRAKARQMGLLAADQSITDEEALQLILEPGFSTADRLTQQAGRGVGMDVVATEVKKLGGGLFIESVPGRGARFTIRLPFTLAITQALIVRVHEELYALPVATVEGVARLPREEVLRHVAAEVPTFEYGGQTYRFQYLGAFVGTGPSALPESEAAVPVILVRAGEHSTALVTDELVGSREIVVKSLGPQIAGIRGISGATILGDGRIVVILDVGALVRSEWRSRAVDEAVVPTRDDRIFALVVDDSITVRRVTQRLLERNGMRVLTAKDGVDAIALLQEHVPDVLLLDIEMPRMDGYEVAAHVRSDPRLADVPIIMITSRVGDKHRARAIELGVDDYLGKPYQESQLLDAIEPLVLSRRQQID